MPYRKILIAIGACFALFAAGSLGKAYGTKPWIPPVTGQITMEALHQRIAQEKVPGRLLVEEHGARFIAPDGQVLRVLDFASRINRLELGFYAQHRVPVIGEIDVALQPGESTGWARVMAQGASLFSQGFFILLYGAIILLVLLSLRQFSGVAGQRFRRVKPGTLRLIDVAGQDGPKHELAEVVDYLKAPSRFTALGARAPRGVLLYGPPGNGKTMLAKAVAGEAAASFIEQNASSFMQLYVGAGAMAVRRLFQAARKSAPCVIFIDELDAVGGLRQGGSGSHDERLQTLNALLAEMDGMQDNGAIVVIAATNRLDALDPALTRPGRFDRKVLVPLPGKTARAEILGHYLAKLPNHTLDGQAMASRAHSFSGADLAAWVNEAAIEAARAGDDCVRPVHADRARDRILLGPVNQGLTLDQATLRTTAFHEAGHALIKHRQQPGSVDMVSIRPRGQALGVTVMHDQEELLTPTREDLERSLRVLLAGRAAEEVSGQEVSVGAANDLERVSSLAVRAVTTLGLGSFGAFVPQHEQLRLEAEREAASWVNAIYADVVAELRRSRGQLETVALALLDNGDLDGRAFAALVDGLPAESVQIGHFSAREPAGTTAA